MDQFKATILLIFISQSVFATSLCDNSCDLEITFPNGGTIEAIEPLTIIFDIGGSLNLGVTGTINSSIQLSSTDFSSGGTLILSEGESISFDANGSLETGNAGNFNYSNISIQGDSIVNITAIEGTQSIYLNTLTTTGNSIFNLSAQYIYISGVDSSGSLTINGDDKSNILFLDSVSAYTPAITSGASIDVFVIGENNSPSLGTSNTLGNTNLISNSSVNLTSNFSISTTTAPILLNTADTINVTNSATWSINTDGIQFVEPDISLDSQLTVNGQSCSPLFGQDTPQCETEGGTIYQFSDGEWIEVESTGMLSPLNLVMLYLVLLFRRKKHKI